MRQLGSHVHGEAGMTLVLDGHRLELDFQIPAMDLLGFEHQVRHDEDKQRVTNLLQQLRQPTALVALPEAARCLRGNANITSAMLLAAEADSAGDHPDFSISYQFSCDQPDALRHLTITAFTHFPSLKKLDVSWIRDAQQGAAQLSPDKTELLLR